jgi:hypothetical protein
LFRIETKKDIALARRAIKEGWEYDRSEVVAALFEVMALRDPELMIEAAKVLLLGDTVAAKQAETEIKREKLELEKRQYDDKLRLRLIELATNAGLIPASGVKAVESNKCAEKPVES